MRLLLSWVQIHPALGETGRIQAGTHQAVDAEDFDAGRRFEPDTDIAREQLDARMAADPPRSVDDFLALVSAELQTALGFHVTPQKSRPRPEPEPEAAPPEDVSTAPAAPTP